MGKKDLKFQSIFQFSNRHHSLGMLLFYNLRFLQAGPLVPSARKFTCRKGRLKKKNCRPAAWEMRERAGDLHDLTFSQRCWPGIRRRVRNNDTYLQSLQPTSTPLAQPQASLIVRLSFGRRHLAELPVFRNIRGKLKVKVTLQQATKAQRGSRRIAFNLGARWGGGGQHHAQAA